VQTKSRDNRPEIYKKEKPQDFMTDGIEEVKRR
jgi:hypothetical protein